MKSIIGRTAALISAAAVIAMCPLSAEAATLETENGIRYIRYDSGETKAYTGWTTKIGKTLLLQKRRYEEKLLAYRKRLEKVFSECRRGSSCGKGNCFGC